MIFMLKQNDYRIFVVMMYEFKITRIRLSFFYPSSIDSEFELGTIDSWYKREYT